MRGVGCRGGPPDPAHAAPQARLLVATMSVVVLTVAVLQTGVVPDPGGDGPPTRRLPVDVSWTVTANLLAAAATTPLLGRLADLHIKKRVLLAVLVVVLAGSLLAQSRRRCRC